MPSTESALSLIRPFLRVTRASSGFTARSRRGRVLRELGASGRGGLACRLCVETAGTPRADHANAVGCTALTAGCHTLGSPSRVAPTKKVPAGRRSRDGIVASTGRTRVARGWDSLCLPPPATAGGSGLVHRTTEGEKLRGLPWSSQELMAEGKRFEDEHQHPTWVSNFKSPQNGNPVYRIDARPMGSGAHHARRRARHEHRHTGAYTWG